MEEFSENPVRAVYGFKRPEEAKYLGAPEHYYIYANSREEAERLYMQELGVDHRTASENFLHRGDKS